MSHLRAGQPAPDFELPDQDGNAVRLSQFRGVSPVVIFFYPKDDTSGCTKEACGFRERFGEFRAAGVRILGISSDSPASHRRFADKYDLPFTLLSDIDGSVRRLYGVRATMGIIPGRASFVIDRDGRLLSVYNSQFRPLRHVHEALKSLTG